MMSKTKYFSSYQSSNILIVPTSNESIPPLKRTKMKNDTTENTQIFNKSNTQVETNPTETVPIQKNVAEGKHLIYKNIPLIDSELNKIHTSEEMHKEINECDINTENTVNSKIKTTIILPDSLKTSKNCVKELSMGNYVNKSEGKLTEPKSLKRSIDKSSEKFSITSMNIKESLWKSDACEIKHKICTNTTNLIDNNKRKTKNKSKISKKLTTKIETDKYLEHSLHKNDSTIDTKIYNDKIQNSNNNLKLTSKKSHFYKQAKTKIDRHDKMKDKMRKRFKIIINVTYKNLHEATNTKTIGESDHNKYPDLSFLDDFGVDEIVDSLLSCNDTKENISKGFQVQGDSDNILIKSPSLFTEENITKEDKNNLKLTKIANKPTENTYRKIKNAVPHILQDAKVKKLDKESHGNDRSMEKVINKIKTNKQKNCKKVVKILHQKNNNATEAKTDFNESKVCETKVFKKQLVLRNNIIHAEETPKNLSSITVKEKKNVMNSIKTQREQINHECSLNEYHRKELLFRKLEIKMCDLLKEKCSINTVAYYGKFSKIYKCVNIVTGKIYAIKMLNEFDDYKGKSKKEMLWNVQHEIPKENLFCISLMNTFILDGHLCFITNYYPFNLQHILQNERKSFHIDEICNLSMQLVLALIVIRNKNIVHSDIKPSHILLNSELKVLKLCGFDEAYYYYNSDNLSANIGSVNYRAPEIIMGYSNGFSVDIWSTAVVMYEMVSGSILFSGETNNEILYKQISTFGDLPRTMIMQSRYGKDHFLGTNFVRDGYCNKRKDNINDFGINGSLQKMIMNAYDKHWGVINTKNDFFKLNLLCHLLKKMLTLNPKHRLPVEFVYANPFFSAKRK